MLRKNSLSQTERVIQEAIQSETDFKESTLQLCQIIFALEQQAPLNFHCLIPATESPAYLRACQQLSERSNLIKLFFETLLTCFSIDCLRLPQTKFPQRTDQVLSRVLALGLDNKSVQEQILTIQNELLGIQKKDPSSDASYAYASALIARKCNIASHLFHDHLADMKVLSLLHTKINALNHKTCEPIGKEIDFLLKKLSLSHLLQDARGSHPFQAFTIKGTQRMMKYPLLLGEVSKSLGACELSSQVIILNEGIKKIISFINAEQHDAEELITARNNEILMNLEVIRGLNRQFESETAVVDAPSKASLDELAQAFSLCLNQQYGAAPIFLGPINSSIDKMIKHTQKPLVIDVQGHEYRGTQNPRALALKYQHVLTQGYVPRVETRSLQQLYQHPTGFQITTQNPVVLWAQLIQAGQDGVIVNLSREARMSLHKHLKKSSTPSLILSVLNEPSDSLAQRFQLFTELFKNPKYAHKIRIKHLTRRPLVHPFVAKSPPPTPSAILKQMTTLKAITHNIERLNSPARAQDQTTVTQSPPAPSNRRPEKRLPLLPPRPLAPPPPPFKGKMSRKQPPPPPPFYLSRACSTTSYEVKEKLTGDTVTDTNTVILHKRPQKGTASPPPPKLSRERPTAPPRKPGSPI